MPVRIVVVGSLMTDLVVRVPRLPVVGESLIGHSFEVFVGGKGGNQALAAVRAGASHVSIIGRVGDDDFGRRITDELTTGGVDCSFVTLDPREGTGVAVPIVLDDGRNAIVALPRANLALAPAHVFEAGDAIRAADMVLVQFEVGMAAIEAAMRIAREANVPVLLNPAPIAPHPANVPGLASVIVANEIEAAALVPTARGDHAAEAGALRDLGPSLAVVTLGAAGAVVANSDSVSHVPAFVVEAVDSVGAGDAFCGALAVALCEGMSAHAAVRFAGAAGALACTRPGAAPSLPTRRQIESLLAAHEP